MSFPPGRLPMRRAMDGMAIHHSICFLLLLMSSFDFFFLDVESEKNLFRLKKIHRTKKKLIFFNFPFATAAAQGPHVTAERVHSPVVTYENGY